MKATALTLVGLALAFGLITQLAYGQEKKQEAQTVEGELLDMRCYSAGGASGEGHAGCARKCLASGIPAGVLVDETAWVLVTNPVPFAPHAAQTVRVTGKVNEETKTIIPNKIEVKDGDGWKEVKMQDAHNK